MRYNSLTITLKDKIVRINVLSAMGGGTEGWYVQLEGHPTDHGSIIIPYTDSPETEWSILSPVGHENVRKNGWRGMGSRKHAIGRALYALGLTEDPTELSSFIKEKETATSEAKHRADVEYALLLEDNAKATIRQLEFEISTYLDFKEILEVARDLPSYVDGLQTEWGDWPIPA